MRGCTSQTQINSPHSPNEPQHAGRQRSHNSDTFPLCPVNPSPLSSCLSISLLLLLATSGLLFFPRRRHACLDSTGGIYDSAVISTLQEYPPTPPLQQPRLPGKQAAGVVGFGKRRGSNRTSAWRCYLPPRHSNSFCFLSRLSHQQATSPEVSQISGGAPTIITWDSEKHRRFSTEITW